MVGVATGGLGAEFALFEVLVDHVSVGGGAFGIGVEGGQARFVVGIAGVGEGFEVGVVVAYFT